MHSAQPSETYEYSILAGKTLEKYLLGKYTRNASAESYVLGCVEADYENSGEKLGRRVCRLDELKVLLSARTKFWDKTATMFVNAYKCQQDPTSARFKPAF